jgi:LTXXQ motif family protein
MITVRFLRATAFCICLFTVAAHAQVPETQIFERLHGALNLTPAQEDGWKMLEQAYAIDPQEMAHHRNAAATMPTLTAPQRVDLSINLMKADLESLERRGAALKGFYATLSPQQQSIFDRQTLPPQQGRY